MTMVIIIIIAVVVIIIISLDSRLQVSALNLRVISRPDRTLLTIATFSACARRSVEDHPRGVCYLRVILASIFSIEEAL